MRHGSAHWEKRGIALRHDSYMLSQMQVQTNSPQPMLPHVEATMPTLSLMHAKSDSLLPSRPRRLARAIVRGLPLLAVALVDPVTRPLSPTADNDAIYAEIAASNPALTDSPAPAEQRLARRATPRLTRRRALGRSNTSRAEQHRGSPDTARSPAARSHAATARTPSNTTARVADQWFRAPAIARAPVSDTRGSADPSPSPSDAPPVARRRAPRAAATCMQAF